MVRPGDEAAAFADSLRVSHADREQVIDVIKAAFVQGRLDKGEFDLRVGRALESQTCAELAAVTADLPAGQPGHLPPTDHRRQRRIINAKSAHGSGSEPSAAAGLVQGWMWLPGLDEGDAAAQCLDYRMWSLQLTVGIKGTGNSVAGSMVGSQQC